MLPPRDLLAMHARVVWYDEGVALTPPVADLTGDGEHLLVVPSGLLDLAEFVI